MTAAAPSQGAMGLAEASPALPRPQEFDRNPPSAVLFWALMTFFVLEFLRPPVLSQLRFQMLFVIVIPILWLMSKDRPWSHIISLQLAMLAQAAVSITFASNYFTAFIGTRTMWPNCVAALAIFWILSREKYFSKAIWVWALIMAYQAFYATAIGGGHGFGGFLGDENDLAMAVGMSVPFMLMGMQLYGGWRRWLSLALLVLLIVGIVASQSRGGFLGLAAAVGYCLFYSANRARNFAIILVGGLIFFMAIPKDYKEELGSIRETNTGTAEARFFLWTAATRMWMDNPILGVGAMNSSWLIGRYQPDVAEEGALFSGSGYRERDWTTTPTHSIYFEMLSETGLVGVGLFGGLVWMHFGAVRRTRRKVQRSRAADRTLKRDAELYGVALSGAMIGFLVCGAFLSILYYPFFYYFTALSGAYEVMIMRRLRFSNALAGVLHARDLEADSSSGAADSRSLEGGPPALPATPSPAKNGPKKGGAGLSELLS